MSRFEALSLLTSTVFDVFWLVCLVLESQLSQQRCWARLCGVFYPGQWLLCHLALWNKWLVLAVVCCSGHPSLEEGGLSFEVGFGFFDFHEFHGFLWETAFGDRPKCDASFLVFYMRPTAWRCVIWTPRRVAQKSPTKWHPSQPPFRRWHEKKIWKSSGGRKTKGLRKTGRDGLVRRYIWYLSHLSNPGRHEIRWASTSFDRGSES